MTCKGLPCSIRDRRVQNLQAILPHLQRPAQPTSKISGLRFGPGVRLALGVVSLVQTAALGPEMRETES